MSDVIKLNGRAGSIRVKVKNDSDDEYSENREPTQEEYYQKQLQSYYQKGLGDGYTKAKKELEETFQNELVKRSVEFEKILMTLESNLKSYEEVFDKIVIEVAVNISEKIVKHEIEKQTIIGDSLRESIRKVLGANQIKIKINPDDHEIITSDGKNILLNESYSKIKFEHDSGIDPGGCYIETEIGNVDSRISTQLAEIKRQLETSFINPVL